MRPTFGRIFHHFAFLCFAYAVFLRRCAVFGRIMQLFAYANEALSAENIRLNKFHNIRMFASHIRQSKFRIMRIFRICFETPQPPCKVECIKTLSNPCDTELKLKIIPGFFFLSKLIFNNYSLKYLYHYFDKNSLFYT